MDKIVDVANYMLHRYKELTGKHLTHDVRKLHILLYFTQREAFAVIGKPAFVGDFVGWKHGPVSIDVRNSMIDGEVIVKTKPISDDVQYIVSNIILGQGSLALWKLTEMVCKEMSWLNSRKGLDKEDPGDRFIVLEDICEDAKKVRPYDFIWDMYYDEFEDADNVKAR